MLKEYDNLLIGIEGTQGLIWVRYSSKLVTISSNYWKYIWSTPLSWHYRKYRYKKSQISTFYHFTTMIELLIRHRVNDRVGPLSFDSEPCLTLSPLTIDRFWKSEPEATS